MSWLALCCFAWTAATGPVDGYFVFLNGKPTTHVKTERACIEVTWEGRVEVQAYHFAGRRVGPMSEPWGGEHWGRCQEPQGRP